MEENYVIRFLDQIEPIEEDLKASLLKCADYKTYPRKLKILTAGAVCRELGFLQKGLAVINIKTDEKDMPADIILENQFMCVFESFITQSPSRASIEAVEDCEVWVINHRELQNLYAQFPQMQRIGRILAERHYVSMVSHAHMLRFYNTRQRYEYLLQHRPEIIQRVPLGMIASYLGMSLENLSRVRKAHPGK